MSLNVNSQPQDMPAGAEEFLGLALPRSQSHAVEMLVDAYLTQLDPDALSEPKKITNDLLYMIEHQFVQYNKNADAGSKWKILHELPPAAIATVMLRVHNIRNINFAGENSEREYGILGIYQEWGENEGIYITSEPEIRNAVRRYGAVSLEQMKLIIQILTDSAGHVEPSRDPDLIAVNNGIFNYRTKILQPFSPDIVFTAKSHTDYNPNAANVIIHNDDDNTDWDIETWVKELFNDPEIPELIWQVLGAVIRPNVKWNKCSFFYSVTGNNGKGCLCQLMRNLTGTGSYASIPLSEFGKDFMLEPLIRATSIITDENDVGVCIDKAANLKAVITNDVILLNRKHRVPVTFRFRGHMVQCVNSLPLISDKSDSLYRRLLLIPFDKCYTGIERRYIKDDYLNRREVLEYVLYRVLNMDYYELKEPGSCMSALAEYKIYNDPVRDFLNEILPDISWDALTNQLVFDLYVKWTEKNNPNGKAVKKSQFLNEMRSIIGSGMHGWKCYKDPKSVPVIAQWYNSREPILEKYGLGDRWCRYGPGATIRGLLRDKPKGSQKNGLEVITTD